MSQALGHGICKTNHEFGLKIQEGLSSALICGRRHLKVQRQKCYEVWHRSLDFCQHDMNVKHSQYVQMLSIIRMVAKWFTSVIPSVQNPSFVILKC